MKLEAQLVELVAWRAELTKIALAIAVVILVCSEDLSSGDDG